MGKNIMTPGDRFDKLTAVCFNHRDRHGKQHWLFVCECGGGAVCDAGNVKRGRISSCGCIRRELVRGLVKQNTTHGMSKTAEFRAWRGMKERCGNPNTSNYGDYGGRGITVCARWASFAAFFADMGCRPTADHSIERVDNDAGYCLENCRWATRVEQGRNKRNNILMRYQGRTLCASAWNEELGFPRNTVSTRMYLGWSIERALTQPVKVYPPTYGSGNNGR